MATPSPTLFPDDASGERPTADRLDLYLPDGELRYEPDAFDAAEADRLFAALQSELPWEQHHVRIAGREIACPRLSAWIGDPEARYGYSGQQLEPRDWTPALQRVRERLALLTGVRFDGVLANLYRDGSDGMGWHSDNERELGPCPVIASVSFGAVRRFRLRHRTRRELPTREISLAHGSLLVLAGTTQQYWKHSVPKTARPTGPRVNLTFRRLGGAR